MSVHTQLPPVPALDTVTADHFARAVLPQGRPVVMRGLIRHWPAVRHGQVSAHDLAMYLKSMDNGHPTSVLEGNSAIKGRLDYGPDLTDFNFHRRTKSISAGLDQVLAAMAHPNPPAIYVQSTLIHEHLPRFEGENPHPLMPPAIRPRIWISNATRAQTHNDHDHNLACVVGGRRRFILFPPEQVKNLYIGPMDHTPSGRAISLASLEEPDFARFPRLQAALATAQVADLEPGDVLYVPKYWWHHVQSLETFNVLVNYWWGNSAQTLDNPMAAFLTGLLSLKDIAPQDRDYWKAMFHYYVFQTDGDPVAHIPAARQGGLGKPTQQTRLALVRELKKLADRT